MKPNKKLLIVMGLVSVAMISWTALSQVSLAVTEKTVAKKFKVPNISHQDLAKALQSNPNQWVLFDTRAQKEYEVSHLQDAIQLDPDISAVDFIEHYGPMIKDKKVVFYCSVGYRSSMLLKRVQPELKEQGAKEAWNLTGGIFRWYNERNPVFKNQQKTDEVHPYDKVWGALLVKDPN